MKKKKIIIGNWKMAPRTLKEAKKTFSAIKKTAASLRNVQTVICPPFIYVSDILKLVSGHRTAVGVQNASHEEVTARTGEISTEMLTALHVQYIIVGHSERRAMGEDNELIRKKVHAFLKAGFVVVLCVGEIDRDKGGTYISFIKEQLHVALKGVHKKFLKNIVIAYEPIWAIGKNAKRPASVEDSFEMHIFIKKVLASLLGKDRALRIPILYGGSVNPENAEGFLRDGGVDGFLIGRASRDAEKFSAILHTANKIK